MIILICEIIGVISSSLAATVMDFGILKPQLALILLLFSIGNICIGYSLYKRKVWWLFGLTAYYLLINLYGLIKLGGI